MGRKNQCRHALASAGSGDCEDLSIWLPSLPRFQLCLRFLDSLSTESRISFYFGDDLLRMLEVTAILAVGLSQLKAQIEILGSLFHGPFQDLNRAAQMTCLQQFGDGRPFGVEFFLRWFN